MPVVGQFLVVRSGDVRGQIDQTSGRLEIIGPNRKGEAEAVVINIAAMIGVINGASQPIGAVRSFTDNTDHIEMEQEFGGGTIKTRLSLAIPSVVRYEVVDWRGQTPQQTAATVSAEASEHFYGLGEKFNTLDQVGKQVDIRTFDEPANKGDRSYKVAPWLVSTRGYGFHLDSTARSTFDLRIGGGTYNVTNQAGKLTFHLVFGPELVDVVDRYTQLTGRPSLPPPFAFGTWISTDIWRSGGEVRYAVTKFLERKIAGSVFVFDSPWETAYNDFKFNIGSSQTTQFGRSDRFEQTDFAGFSSLTEMMTFFRENGLKVICWMTPFINTSSDDEFIPGQNLGAAVLDDAQDSFFVQDATTNRPISIKWWKGTGRPVDFTHAPARAWITERLKDLVKECQVSTKSGTESAIGGFKTDDGEFGTHGNTYIPSRARFSNGETGDTFVNGYCTAYHQTIHSVLGDQGVLLARSGFTGAQAFSGSWAGDNEPNFGDENGLRSVIVAGLSAAMCGFSVWGHDIGGYLNGNFSPVSKSDLLIRWTQFGCFSPIFQMHRQVNRNNLQQYPWGYPKQGETTQANAALENFEFYARLHTRLFPYIYTAAQKSRDAGLPIMRPLVLMHPDDPQTYPVQHTYYFGPDLLVAPIITPSTTTRRIYLPEGTWFDFWSNQQFQGKQVITWNAPTQPAAPKSKIPVFCRQGAIIPFIQSETVQSLCDADYVNNSSIETWNGDLEVRLYPDANTSTTLFDGTTIQCAQSGAGTEVTIDSPTPRSVLLCVRTAKPAAVGQNGAAIAELNSPPAFRGATTGWQYNNTLGVALIKFSHPGTTTRIKF